MVDPVMFSHNSDEWRTPESLFNRLHGEFEFTIDIAASEDNHLLPRFIDANCGEGKGFLNPAYWLSSGDKAFCNPPYSKIGAFMEKCYKESLHGATVVCLIPSRTDTRYWHEYVMRSSEIRFVKGRIKFENRMLPSWREDGAHKMSSAPFPSAVVVFNSEPDWNGIKISGWHGAKVSSMEWK